MELFREFEAYVRSIYVAATAGAVSALEKKAADLGGETQRLQEVVQRSRENYAALFDPAVQRLLAASAESGRLLTTQIEEQISPRLDALAAVQKRTLAVVYGFGISVVIGLLAIVYMLVRK